MKAAAKQLLRPLYERSGTAALLRRWRQRLASD